MKVQILLRKKPSYIKSNVVNNTLKAFTQLPINNKKEKEYTDPEWMNLVCIADLQIQMLLVSVLYH